MADLSTTASARPPTSLAVVTSSMPSPTPTATPPYPALSDETFPALTTTWSVPEAGCGYTYDVNNTAGHDRTTAWLDWDVNPLATTLTCYPPGMFGRYYTGTFSPASCPLGWYTVEGQDSNSRSGTMTRTCCSKDYTLNGEWCERPQPTAFATPATYNTDLATHSNFLERRLITNATLAHRRIVVMFQHEDQDVLGITDDPGTGSSEAGGYRSMALGVRAAIGIGAAAIFALLLFTAVSCFRWRWEQKLHRQTKREIRALELENGLRMAAPGDSSDDYRLDTMDVETELDILRRQQELIQRRIEEIELNSQGKPG